MGTNTVAAGNEVGKLVKEVLPGDDSSAIFSVTAVGPPGSRRESRKAKKELRSRRRKATIWMIAHRK